MSVHATAVIVAKVLTIITTLMMRGFISVFYRYTDDKRSVHRICGVAFAVIVLVYLYGAIGVAGLTKQSKSSMATAMGAISISTSIGLVCWVVYAVIIVDLILYVVYPTSKTTETQLQSVMIDHPDEASISIVFNTQEVDRLGQKSSVDLKDSLDFVAIRSPFNSFITSQFTFEDADASIRLPMSGHDTAVIVAKVLTIITTIMLRISLMPDFNRWRKNRNTGDMSVMPCVLLYTNCYALLYYAYAIDDILPLFATSVLGVVVGGILAYYFYQWTDYKRATMRIFIGSFIICVIVTIYGSLALAGKTGQTRDAVGTTMGFITVTTTIVMYASPMATIVNVIRTKTASSMPFTMGVVVVFNSFCWGFYAALVGNAFILAPNIAGFTLGIIQLSLTFIYPRAAPKVEVDSHTDEPALSVVVLSPIQDCDHERKLSSVDGRKSPSFIAMRSPTREETRSWREMRSSGRLQ
ncbi:hypothetical protein JG688_00008154 [Phytophthora aleatoria]|uniref:Sugar transporter SWEET1 n=1 Tax=Phytophthora aleatoria TaxID=2496075 RepID=A0A8J5IRF3_9STRA|nr:hypothetical protein JG688_00008154 [Phytophthora aleatoria]